MTAEAAIPVINALGLSESEKLRLAQLLTSAAPPPPKAKKKGEFVYRTRAEATEYITNLYRNKSK